jgi:probable rRNA maturation factor
MLDCILSIQIEEPFVGLVAEDWLRLVVETALAAAGTSAPVDIGLVVAGDDTVRNLNRTYRAIDSTTDVLAFALAETGSDGGEHFVMPPDGALHLGEIIISYPQAERQAEEQHHPLKRELALLVAHGVLHLLGYDHEEPVAEQSMRAMEARVLDAIEKEG